MPDYFDEVKSLYQEKVQGIEAEIAGQQRATRGKFVEIVCEVLVEEAWRRAGGEADRLSFGTNKYKLNITEESYLKKLGIKLRADLESKKDKYYKIKVDRHVFIDDIFVMGIECKSFTENAMLKRILVDFTFLKEIHPKLICVLLQLESMLGGDYDKARESVLGSPQSHSIMSKFLNVDLHILTLLEGSRKVKEPIFEAEFFKDLKRENVEHAVEKFKELLAQFVENG